MKMEAPGPAFVPEVQPVVVPSRELPADGRSQVTGLDANRVLDFYATVVSQERLAEAATAFVCQMSADLQFDSVALGLSDGAEIELIAVSDSINFLAQSEHARALVDAMDEAVEQGASVSYPPPEGSRPRITLAHAALVRERSGSVLTVPLVCNGATLGALTIERRDGPISFSELQQCEHLACFVGPILHLKRRDERSLWTRLKAQVSDGWRALRAPDRGRLRVAVGGGALALLALFFVPVEYNVRAPARLEGSVQRVLVAPADGFLRQANVRPGDRVKAGQVLVELADSDLQLERRRRQSEFAQHESAYLGAFARADRTQYAISQAKALEVQAQLELLEQQLARSRVEAPFDGVVIKGDLARSLGAPVERGEVLLTVAPSSEFRLIVDVDERDVASVTAGQRGQLALSALPDRTLTFSVERVTPIANARDGRNAFEVVGALAPKDVTALRPGLEGVAKIGVAERPLAWIISHRIVDWLRLTLWSWGA